MGIRENVQEILEELPQGVELVVIAKGRQMEEVAEAVAAGARIIGENYIQEAEKAYAVIGRRVAWHFTGHLQKNKVKKAVSLFDVIETVDSYELAQELDQRCRQINKVMPVLIEVNSGCEPQKTGVLPVEVIPLVKEISSLANIKVVGLMTMGPYVAEPEKLRTCFAETKRLFDRIKTLGWPHVEMKYLSMGMSGSYRVAIEEGANLVRIGTKIFSEKPGNGE